MIVSINTSRQALDVAMLREPLAVVSEWNNRVGKNDLFAKFEPFIQ